ncbi:MAG: hypothetical protein AAF385_08150 [Pseudomonadota bacterium]
MKSFTEQLRRHSVALISLAVAITGLAYNTWRNELSEENRTVREAAIAALMHVGEFEKRVNLARWGMQNGRQDNLIDAWSYVQTLNDLKTLMPAGAEKEIQRLHEVWTVQAGSLQKSGDPGDRATKAITDEISAVRLRLISVLESLT